MNCLGIELFVLEWLTMGDLGGGEKGVREGAGGEGVRDC